jgi:hypothetical protein
MQSETLRETLKSLLAFADDSVRLMTLSIFVNFAVCEMSHYQSEYLTECIPLIQKCSAMASNHDYYTHHIQREAKKAILYIEAARKFYETTSM